MTSKPDMLLWLDNHRGVYIPRDFASSFTDRAKCVSGVSDADWEILEAGPDHEFYWDTWCDVEQNAVVTDDGGVRYRIYQDGDCWLIPEGMVYNDTGEGDMFIWPSTEETEENAQ